MSVIAFVPAAENVSVQPPPAPVVDGAGFPPSVEGQLLVFADDPNQVEVRRLTPLSIGRPRVLRRIPLSNSGPWASCKAPVDRQEGGTYNRVDSCAPFLTRQIDMGWELETSVPTAALPPMRLMVDEVPVTDWVLPGGSNGRRYNFSFTAELGHHVAYPQAQGYVIREAALPFTVNDTGAPLPDHMQNPWTATMRFDWAYGLYGNYATQFQYTTNNAPVVRPFRERVIENTSVALGFRDKWVNHWTLNVSARIIHRWAQLPTGDVCIERYQMYFHGDAITSPTAKVQGTPRYFLTDGPKGQGAIGPVSQITSREGRRGAYKLETAGRFTLVKRDGAVITEGGWRVKPGRLKVHSDVTNTNFYMHRSNAAIMAAHRAVYEDQWEYVGDLTQVTGNPHMFEPWHFATTMRRADGSITLRDGHEFWIGDTRNHRILFLDHWTAHSQAGFQPAHFPPVGYVQAPGPIGQSTWCDFIGSPNGHFETIGGVQRWIHEPSAEFNEPWGVAIKIEANGQLKVYWSNFAGGSIYRANIDGTEIEPVIVSPINPSYSELGASKGERLGFALNSNLVTKRALYTVDGPVGTATVIRPTTIRFDSDGNLVWSEHYTYLLRKLDFATGMVTTIAPIIDSVGGSDSSGPREPTFALDDGTNGPIDDALCRCWGGSSDVRIGKDGTRKGQWDTPWQDGAPYLTDGPMQFAQNADYAWAVDAYQGEILTDGNAAGAQSQVISKRQPTDPNMSTTSYGSWKRGRAAFAYAGLGMIFGPDGQGFLGIENIDSLVGLNDADLDTTLTSYGLTPQHLSWVAGVTGMGGKVATMADVRYFIRQCGCNLAV